MTIEQAKEVLRGMLKLCYPDSLEGTARAERDHEAIAIALDCMSYCELKRNSNVEEYREKVLKAILDYEKMLDHVEQYEVANAIAELYEIIRSIEN